MKATSYGWTGCSKDVIEKVVCKADDLQENEMKSFEVDNTNKVLLVKQDGKIFAVGNKCTHYGASLATGVLGKGRVRCPWHGACFNLSTGDIEDFPGLDSLPCYNVEVLKDGGVKIRGVKSQVVANKRVKPMTKRDVENTSTFIIAGGGPAGLCCAETLRQEGYQGRLVMLLKEPVLPYDRIKLSKALNMTAEKLELRDAEFFKAHDIEVMLNTELLNLDTASNLAHISSGDPLSYTSIFLASGSSAVRLNIEGSNLKNVFAVRDVKEANTIAEAISSEKDVVVLGTSFIGMEVAAYCIGKAKSVTVVGKGLVPFEPVLGEKIGSRIKTMFEEKGVKFVLGSGIVKVLPSDKESDTIGEVELTDGVKLPANVLITGIGATANTLYLSSSNVDRTDRGAVIVDKFLETNVKGVFAGGDIAHAPVLGKTASIGHWQLAHYHGHVAAHNMLAKNMEMKAIPFFWTMLFGKSIRYAGFAPKVDDVILEGSVDDLQFVAYICEGSDVVAIATCGRDPLAAKFAEFLHDGGKLTKQEVEADPTRWYK